MADTAYNNKYKKQQRVSFLNFLAELPNFVAVFASAVLSGSLIMWMDFIDSLCNVADSGFVTLLSRKLKRDLKYEYNYGIGKIEAISSLCCEGILILGLFIIFASSVHELINPKSPSGLLVYVVLLKIINIAFDAFFLKEQYKIKNNGASEITNAKFYSAIKCFAFDAVTLVSVFVCWLFRKYRASWYFSPVICIVLVCIFLVLAVLRMKNSVEILTDRTLPEKEQMKILRVLSKFNDRYEEFEFLSSRISGETVFIDLEIKFCDDTSYAQIKELCREISIGMKEQIPKSRVSIVVDGE